MDIDQSVCLQPPKHNAFKAIVQILAQNPPQEWQDVTKIALIIGFQLKLAGIDCRNEDQVIDAILYLVKSGVLEVNASDRRKLRLKQGLTGGLAVDVEAHAPGPGPGPGPGTESVGPPVFRTRYLGRSLTPLEQLEEWVVGNNVHNVERDECCPDFACCQTTGHFTPELRKKFLTAYIEGGAEAVEPMLFMGLTGLLSTTEVETYIAGDARHIM